MGEKIGEGRERERSKRILFFKWEGGAPPPLDCAFIVSFLSLRAQCVVRFGFICLVILSGGEREKV